MPQGTDYRCDFAKETFASMEAAGDFDKEEFGFAQELVLQYGGDYADDDCEVFRISAKDIYVLMKVLGYDRKPQTK